MNRGSLVRIVFKIYTEEAANIQVTRDIDAVIVLMCITDTNFKVNANSFRVFSEVDNPNVPIMLISYEP